MYRLLRLFLMKKSERTHAAAPPFQIEPAPLGFDLVPVKALDGCFHPAITRLIRASFVSLFLDLLSFIIFFSDNSSKLRPYWPELFICLFLFLSILPRPKLPEGNCTGCRHIQ